MNITLYAFLFFAIFPSLYISSNEVELRKQYNSLAKEFSALAPSQNQDNISAYFQFFDMPLEGKKILDLGCGDGFDLGCLKSRKALIYGIDASEEMVKLAQQKNPEGIIKVGYFEDIPFEDQSFDFVISKWAISTSAQIDPIYREIIRVLKPGGKLIYLATHPIRQFLEKKYKGKNYFEKEIVTSVLFDGQVTCFEPSHTFNEYFSPTFFEHFNLEKYDEGHASGAESVDGDRYPGYFIVQAARKENKK